jgi:hypothetical protein
MGIYNIQWFDFTRSNSDPRYEILLSPTGHHGGQGMKVYSSKEAFSSDLKERLRISDRIIEGFFANPETNYAVKDWPLTDENAAYFGQHH